MKAESAANAACVRGEIVCFSTSFYQSLYLVLRMYLTRAQAAFAAVASGGQFVSDSFGWLCERNALSAATAGMAIPQRRLLRTRR
jgi:hypothetical protein